MNPAWKDEQTEAAILGDISLDEPWALIEQFANLVRLSGSEDEAKAVRLITDKLDRWGLDYTVHHPTCLISLPGPATLRTVGDNGREYTVKTPSFSPNTDGQEVEAELVYIPGNQAAVAMGSLFLALGIVRMEQTSINDGCCRAPERVAVHRGTMASTTTD